MDLAARNGFIETVKFLHLNRQEGATTEAFDEAAKNGHLKVCSFLNFHRKE
eukprot:Pgem_evm1s14734